MRTVISALVMATTGALVSSTPMTPAAPAGPWHAQKAQKASAAQPARPVAPPPDCNALFLTGIAGGSPLAVTKFSVSFRITASYTFKDPSLAHETIPQVFIAAMNAQNTRVQYALADGANANLTIDLNVTHDGTSDHYGMSTEVWGPRTFNFNGVSTSSDTVSYFAFRQDPLYVTGDKLINDAAARATGYLNGGWICPLASSAVDPRGIFGVWQTCSNGGCSPFITIVSMGGSSIKLTDHVRPFPITTLNSDGVRTVSFRESGEICDLQFTFTLSADGHSMTGTQVIQAPTPAQKKALDASNSRRHRHDHVAAGSTAAITLYRQ